jgi:signal recognition particle subunit SRP68
MSAERAWAAAMAMKSAQSTENTQKKMAGSTRRQIISRLSKAIQYANHLLSCLKDSAVSRANNVDNMEAAAYLTCLQGGLQFEKERWDACIQNYSVARVIYATLSSATQIALFKDLLSSTVDPSIRYAAYQLRLPRIKAVSDIAIERFPAEESELRERIQSLNSGAFLSSEKAEMDGEKAAADIPSTVTWRQRTVKIEDATIAQAIAVADRKERELSQIFTKVARDARELATAYDDVIDARQEAADATKSAIDELVAEGVDTSDSRVQSLQLTRTAVNYAVIELRIGRGRVLCGTYHDAVPDHNQSKRSRGPRKDGETPVVRRQGTGTTLARLRERVALYDSILQNIDAVKDLSGVAGDSGFMEELSSKRAYFRAQKYAVFFCFQDAC